MNVIYLVKIVVIILIAIGLKKYIKQNFGKNML